MKIKTKDIPFKIQQFIILVLHLILLKWMWFTLGEAGMMSMTEVLLHFTGMSVFGALLIRTCAYLARRKYIKEGGQIIG